LLDLLSLLLLLLVVITAAVDLLAGQEATRGAVVGPIEMLVGGGAVVDGLALGASQQVLLSAASGTARRVHGRFGSGMGIGIAS